MMSQNKAMDVSLYQRLWSERRVRAGAKAAGIFGLCLSTIYLTTSDRTRLEERVHTRIEASGKKDNNGGLTINGVSVPLSNSGDTIVLSLEDFVHQATQAYTVQATTSTRYPIQDVVFSFQQGSGTYTAELDFARAAPQEMKELTFGGDMRLKEIIVTYTDGRHYRIGAR